MSDPSNLPPGVPPAGNPVVMPPNVQAPVVTPPVVVPAPAAPVTLVTPTAPAESTNLSANPDEFKTGNPALDASIGVLISVTGATSTDLQRIVGKALEYGDANLVDTAFVTEKFGKHADQMIALAKAAVEEQGNSQARAVAQVHALAGSKDNWDNAVSIFNQNAPEHLKSAARMLLDAGQLEQGAKLIMDMVQNAGFVPVANGLLQGGVAPSTGGALNAKQFQEGIAALKKEAGNRSLESGPYAQKLQTLHQRRNLGRQQGL